MIKSEIDLQNVETGSLRAFRFDDAAALLTYEAAINFKGWTLPKDSQYTFNNGKLIKGGGNTVNKGAEKLTRNTESQSEKDKAQTSY